MPFSITTHSIMTLSITALNIMTFLYNKIKNTTLVINDTYSNSIMLYYIMRLSLASLSTLI